LSRYLIALPAAALAIALIVAGCGGGGSDNEVTASSITKAEFLKKADAVCERGNEQTQADVAAYVEEKNFSLSKKQTPAQYTAFIEAVLVPNVNKEIEEIRDLGAPSGDEDQVEAILSALEDAVAKAQKESKAVVQERTDLFGRASELAKEYGLKACGQA
jgi:hypothetical protein